MKKLTAGIFATILGVTAMGTADAAVTSKSYVDAAVGTVAQSVTDLGTTVSNTYATKQALEAAEGTLQQNINAVAEVANAAAPQATTYTKTEVDAKIAGVDGATAIAGLQGEIATIKLEQATQNTNITNLQNDKANAADVYTKTEADAAFATAAQGATADATAATVATYGNIVTHNVAEFATAAQGATADATAATVATYGDIVTHDAAEFATAAQGTKADTAVQPAAIGDMATKTWVGEQYYATENFVTTQGYLKSADLATYATQEYANTAATTAANGKDAAIADAKKAGTDAAAAAEAADGKAVAAQGTADEALGKANTNAGAITNLEAFDNSIKTATEGSVDGTYTLTMKKTGDAMEFGWELIQRDGTLN